ncbi:hypothetical protein DPMN_180863 [Dreissena polymorpha]|uniref:Uncharacterized protein n=1 Tax=Dreissena polymorpha TaxID=45954 RepID=A0A9D4I359_DREPO|nr:hypothetical protein DPMN_180863 [Dreissena polymorpha]
MRQQRLYSHCGSSVSTLTATAASLRLLWQQRLNAYCGSSFSTLTAAGASLR